MLTEINIRNFAIIEELRMQFHSGFNVLTGETGAGKSIILDAVMLILGGRADTTMIRAGATEAYIEATFSLTQPFQEAVHPILTAEGLDDEEGDGLMLAREIRHNGRNICRVNGRAVNLSVLREIAEPLIDIHGQGEHLSLLKPRSHLPLLDAYAGLQEEQKAFAKEVASFTKLQHELDELRRNERQRTQRIDMLQFQIKEVDAANLSVGEEEDLRAERTRLANAEQLMRSASEAVTLITGLDDDNLAAADMLGQAERALVQLTRYDDTKAPMLERLQGAIYQLSEISSELQSYLDELEYNPSRLDYVEERLELINTLKRKYGDSVAAILAARDKAEQQLDQLGHSEERIGELETLIDALLHDLGRQAAALSQQRKAAVQRLSAAIEAQLADLNMEGAQFSVDFQHEPDEDGVYVDGEQFAFDRTGMDQVEFLISTNPGEPMKPMAKVASGGETARLMLALKTALAQVDATPTLIFDEIDQGIGGRVGDIVGRKLWGLTSLAQHQVIVVTHLPQLAGYGDAHFRVLKQMQDGRTVTAVVELGHVGRVQELAAMLGTQTDLARGGAESILQQASSIKRRDNE